MSGRYMIDERNTDGESSLSLYRAAVSWAASHGDHFEIRVERGRYQDAADASALINLGTAVPAEERQLFGGKLDAVWVKGPSSETVAQELTRTAAPADDLSGDVSPVDEISIYREGRRIYASFDYGSTQLFDLTEDELESLKTALRDSGLDPAYLIPAPEPRRIDI
jgi:hypothetical protein